MTDFDRTNLITDPIARDAISRLQTALGFTNSAVEDVVKVCRLLLDSVEKLNDKVAALEQGQE